MTVTDRPSGAFFGRRKGKRLRGQQSSLVEDLLPSLRVDPEAVADLASLFPRPVSAVWLEIGFGGGEHLLARARANPGIGFIGCEPFVNGMAKMLSAIDAEGIDTIRLWDDDATKLLPALPDAAFERIFLLYPDPWPKRRHHKRRFVGDETVAEFVRLLPPGGLFHFASDIDHYVGWTLAHVARNPGLAWTARRPADWREPYPGWPGTRYEAKAIREGRTPSYLTFERTGA
jgi:tRNA (guanine-N7-)-methyltransferase